MPHPLIQEKMKWLRIRLAAPIFTLAHWIDARDIEDLKKELKKAEIKTKKLK